MKKRHVAADQGASANRRAAGPTTVILWLLLALLWLGAGCSGRSDTRSPSGAQGRSGPEASNRWREELFNYAVDNLNRLEEFNSVAMLQQIVDRLNQWAHSQDPAFDWTPDPLVATLPERFAQLPQVKNLAKLEFLQQDGVALQEAVWLRDVSGWARGKALDDLSRAKQLFDWTVRNIQLEAVAGRQDGPARKHLRQMPWETLLLGQGTAMERAWVWILLARQQGLDAALLGLSPAEPSAGEPQPWAVAILSQHELYLFDPALGLPIPARDGVKLDARGQLDIHPATLAQAAADDSLLRRLDLDPAHPYPVRSSQLQRVVALIEASPAYLAKRMKLLESRLAGKQKIVLTTAASAQAERWKACPRVADARLWMTPYEAILQQTQLSSEEAAQRMMTFLPFQVGQSAELWKGRVLQLKGVFTGETGATQYYQMARPANDDLAAAEAKLKVYHAQLVRQAKPQATEEEIRLEAEKRARFETAIAFRAKQDASYWLGLIAFERANYPGAIDYFTQRTLEASPGGPWTPGALYNLGRTYEAAGQSEKAVQQFRSGAEPSADHGRLLRARWLEELQPKKDYTSPANAGVKVSDHP